MRKILTIMVVLCALFPIVEACSNPILYNEFGVPVSLYGSGYLTVDADDYPEGETKVYHPLEIKNTNDEVPTYNNHSSAHNLSISCVKSLSPNLCLIAGACVNTHNALPAAVIFRCARSNIFLVLM